MKVSIERRINGLWLLVEHDCVIDHVQIHYQNDIGFFIICDCGTIVASTTLKNLWRSRRHYGYMVINEK